MEWLKMHPSEFHPLLQVIMFIMAMAAGLWVYSITWPDKKDWAKRQRKKNGY
jgi:hypothetical protein